MLTSSNLIVIYVVVFTTTAFVVFYLIRLLRHAALELDQDHQRIVKKISLALVLWPPFALAVSATFDLVELVLALMIAVPTLATLWLVSRPLVTDILKKIPLHKIVALSAYRIVGMLFLYLYFSSGALSRGFAMNAGWGDIATALSALALAWFIWKQRPFPSAALILWSVFGILDLIGAPLSALAYGPQQLVSFPLGLIPVFLGPPFGIALHIITLRVAWVQNRLGAGGTHLADHEQGGPELGGHEQGRIVR